MTTYNSVDDGYLQSSARSIKDPIHDFIPLSSFICAFIDTRHFQRLRMIKQLGTSYYVWSGASHNRFEHCIGVAHLARLMVERLKREQPELGITEREVRCVQLAGLCHDLGHGPWSHVWDNLFIPEILPEKKWTHEDASEMMFDDLVQSYCIKIPQEDVDFVKDLIMGAPNHSKNRNPPEKSFLFEIVANKRNGIDVDKFDYIARDTHAIGDRGVFLVNRLIESARVIDNEICYHIKDANQIYELCYTRFSNHKRIYNHKTAKAIEYMIVDGLKAAEPYMHIAEQMMDPKRYIFLTDDIMPRIEMSDAPELAASRAIFDRIRTRDLYKVVDYKTFAWTYQGLLKNWVTPKRIVEAARKFITAVALTEEHIIVDLAPMHYGMKEKNPMDFIKFYSKYNINQSAKAGSGDFSTLMPESFGEVLLRVYTRDVQYFGIVQAGYRDVLESMPELSPQSLSGTEAPSTPSTLSTPPGSRNTSFHLHVAVTPGPQRVGEPVPTSVKGTPFMNNTFTKVPKNFVPKSPSQEYRKAKSDASGVDSRMSSFTLDDNKSRKDSPPATPTRHTDLPEAPQKSAPTSPTQESRRLRRKRGGGDAESPESASLLKRRRG